MRLLLRYNRRNGPPADLAVNVDGELSIGELAAEIARADPSRAVAPANLTVRIDGPERQAVLAPGLSVRSGSLRSGHAVTLVERSSRIDEAGDLGPRAATAIIISGPDAGKEFPLHIGANQIGRGGGNEVPLTDGQSSRAHAIVNVGDGVDIVDLGSTNGIDVNGARVERTALRAQDIVRVGETELRIEHLGLGGGLGSLSAAEPVIAFNRPPNVQPIWEPKEFETPAPPTKPTAQRFPIFILLMPILMGGVLFFATRQWQSVLFVLLSPLLMLGSYFEGKRSGKREFDEAKAYYSEELQRIEEEAAEASRDDAEDRLRSMPSVRECLESARTLDPKLWKRHPDRPLFLTLRFGLGTMPSRVSVKLPGTGDRRMLAEARAIAERFTTVSDVPVAANLVDEGSVGIGGHRGMAIAAARAAVVQLTGLHSPAELVVAAMASSASGADWDWLKWLPHTGSVYSPLGCEHLTLGERHVSALVEELVRVVDERLAGRSGVGGDRELPPLPAIVVVIEEDAPVARSRLVPLLDAGRAVGIHAVWVATSAAEVPASCRAFLTIDVTGAASIGLVSPELETAVQHLETVTAEEAELYARQLSCVVDAGSAAAGVVDLPSAVQFLNLPGTGLPLAFDPRAIIDKWRESSSVRSLLPPKLNPRRPPNTLRAAIGLATSTSMVLDLRADGPHALVAGTTGAGKSEFLQTWVLSMALTHSPERVTFLLVDYKGGAAFSLCDKLPHTVGMVTDLSPFLVRRAMQSLRAELHFRERLLERKKCKDLLEMEKKNDPETPPSLVIVVDEFAALSTEVPEFVDGVVNVAQRGRSLGLHLVLATQRPAGVITDNIRANTNLRVSLRVADTGDSEDVVGVPTAGTFDPSIPGRAIAKLGPTKLVPFQTGYVGGWTTSARQGPSVHVAQVAFGRTAVWEVPEEARPKEAEVRIDDPTDIQRLVATVQQASVAAHLAVPRRPWLPDLEVTYDLFTMASESDAILTFGVLDDPLHQAQIPATVDLDRDGSIAIFGASGSGKSALLRSFAAAASLAQSGGPVHIYGLDFGGRGLQALEALPTVGSMVNGDDVERVTRLVRMLRTTIDERSARFARAHASSIGDYRASTDPSLPRLLVLLDNYAAFESAYDVTQLRWIFEEVSALIGDGRAVGVHFLLTADRRAAMPPNRVSVQRRIVLRLANPDEYANLDVEDDILSRESPAGRGVLDERVVQVAVPAGDASVSGQAAVLHDLAEHLRSTRPHVVAPPVPSLPERIGLDALPTSIGGHPTLGVCDDGRGGIGPVAVPSGESFLVVGPRRSGRSTALATLLASYRRSRPGSPWYLLLSGASPLERLPGWSGISKDAPEAVELLEKLLADTARAPGTPPALVVLDDATVLAGEGTIDDQMEQVFRANRDGKVVVLASAETARINDGYSSFLKRLRDAQQGLVLQWDSGDTDAFNVDLPRTNRVTEPPGRGFLVSPTGATRMHVAE